MQVIILQRLEKDQERIKAAMKKVCPDLLEKTMFFSNLSDAKEHVSDKKKFLQQRNFKKCIVVTGAVLMDESSKKIIKKLDNWNKKAEIILFSIAPEEVVGEKKKENKKTRERIKEVVTKHASGPCDDLAECIKKMYEEMMK